MNPQQKYQEAQVRTASPQELMLMLLDGAIRYADEAKSKLGGREYAESCTLLIRAQRILVELIGALPPEDLAPDIYRMLSGHYWFAHGRLVRANIDHEPRWIDEAVFVVSRIRENWAAAISGGVEAALASAAVPIDVTLAKAGPVSSVNLRG
jgi:flagellar protein FliS